MSSAVIPPNLNETYRNLGSFRKNLVRFYPDRSGTINAGDVLRWTLPKEILCMDTLMKYFEITTTKSATNTATEIRSTHFPRNSASIIDTISVFINGQSFENITNYNHLFNLIYDNTAGFNYYNSGIRALECTDPSIKYTIADAPGNAAAGVGDDVVDVLAADVDDLGHSVVGPREIVDAGACGLSCGGIDSFRRLLVENCLETQIITPKPGEKINLSVYA
jgi:hypothetical protein